MKAETREVKAEELVKEENEEEDLDSEDDDPDRLWCICQQPHDDRWAWSHHTMCAKIHPPPFLPPLPPGS